MGVAVKLVLLRYCRLYLVSCPSLSFLCLFVEGGDLVRPSPVSQAGGGIEQTDVEYILE